jgi:transposase
MWYAGIDLHRRYAVIAVLDSQGEELCLRRVENDAAAWRAVVEALGRPGQAVVEATGNWFWLVDLLAAAGVEMVLANPLQVKAIAHAKLKNDRVDARMLAHLLRSRLIPAAYMAPPTVRTLQELLRHRASVVRMQTGLKTRLRALLAKRNLTIQSASLMSHRAREELTALPLEPPVRTEVEQMLGILDYLAGVLREVDAAIEARATIDTEAQLLMSIPGVGVYLALLILAEIGEVHRFPSPRKLASYAGLVPTTRSSGGHTYHGRITRQGSAWLRWAMILAAVQHVRNTARPLSRFYRRQAARKGTKIARVALARKLLTTVYWILREQQPFDVVVRQSQAAGVSS